MYHSFNVFDSPLNNPFRNLDGSLLFRPGGHGALLENLNDLDSEIVVLKNIDNVTTEAQREETLTFKKILIAQLIELRSAIQKRAEELEKFPNEKTVEQVVNFLKNELQCILPDAFKQKSLEEQISLLKSKLNRPIRICGMVKNEGEAGGGPFWAINPDGSISLQIVESSQLDANSKEQQGLLKQSTHFNPVDIVCFVKDLAGNKIDLMKHLDPQTGFISNKSKDGKGLKALELPGLWNGSMSDWNTLFVEVPINTFSPVKTVNDLLRKEHQ